MDNEVGNAGKDLPSQNENGNRESDPAKMSLDPPPPLALDPEPDEYSFAPIRKTRLLGKLYRSHNMTLGHLKVIFN